MENGGLVASTREPSFTAMWHAWLRYTHATIHPSPIYSDTRSVQLVPEETLLRVLQEPVRGLREAYRVLKSGGVIGVKEFDHGGDLFYPSDPLLKQYNELYWRLRRENGHDPQGGRKVGALLVEAGFSDVRLAACYESIADPKALSGVARVFAGLLSEGWGDAFEDRGWATAEAIREMRDAWLRFPKTPGAFYAGAWCEAVAHKEGTA